MDGQMRDVVQKRRKTIAPMGNGTSKFIDRLPVNTIRREPWREKVCVTSFPACGLSRSNGRATVVHQPRLFGWPNPASSQGTQPALLNCSLPLLSAQIGPQGEPAPRSVEGPRLGIAVLQLRRSWPLESGDLAGGAHTRWPVRGRGRGNNLSLLQVWGRACTRRGLPGPGF